MEELATEEEQVAKARDKTRADLARAAKVAEMLTDDGEDGKDISDIPPHMLGR